MEVKILCPCGSKYKFEVEPLNGELPGPVQCPVCKADGTDAGNRIIAEKLAEQAPSSPPQPAVGMGAAAVRVSIPTSSKPPTAGGFVAPAIPRSSKGVAVAPAVAAAPMAAVAPVAVAAPAMGTSAVAQPPAPPAPVPGGSGKRLSVAGMQAAPAAEADNAAPPPAANAPVTMPTMGTRPVVEESSPSFAKGLAGAGVAGVITIIAWFFIYTYLSRKLGFIAVGLGAFVGWAAAWLGNEKSTRLGVACALVTFCAMLLGSYWAVSVELARENDEILRELYDEEMAFAKEAAKLRTDAEIRAFLAKEYSFEDEPMSAEEVQAEEIAAFREELPSYRRFAEGKVSRVQFEQENRELLEALDGITVIVSLVGISLLWLGLAAASAYKVASS